MRGCTVCERTDDLIKCANPRCEHFVCRRHALSFEVNDAIESRFDYFCSRACYGETQRRAIPFSQELLIAAIVIIIVLAMYLSVVRWFL